MRRPSAPAALPARAEPAPPGRDPGGGAVRAAGRIRPAAGAALALACGLLPACSDVEPPPHFVVVERDLAWRAGPGGPTPRHSLHWSFEDGAQGWTDGAGRVPGLRVGALVVAGVDRAVLRSPEGARLDPELQHRLSFRVEPAGATAVRLRWRAADQDFDDARATSPMPLAAGQGLVSGSVALDELRGRRDATDAAEGLAQIELAFEGPAGTPVEVAVRSITLVSDFDQPDGGPWRLGRNGVYRRGVVFEVAGSLSCALSPGPRDRLRLALAAAGATSPIAVSASLGDDGATHSITLLPGADWSDVVLDLSPRGGAPTTLRLSASGADGTILVGSAMRLRPAPRARPDVVLYLEDTLRRDRLSIYGHPQPTDPALAAIATGGVVVEGAHAASSWTRPSVTTLLSGLDPLAHGNVTHEQRLGPSATTLAEVLADAGYLSVALVTNYHAGAWSGLDQGFDVFAEPPAYGAAAITSTLTSAALEAPLGALLHAHRDEQLLVSVHTLDPHEPYDPPAALLFGLLDGRVSPATGGEAATRSLRYDAEIRHNDQALGALDDALLASGRRDDTLFVFLSDHGEAFGEHGVFSHRNNLFGEELAVPLVLRWPAGLPAGRRVAGTMGLVDVAPTILSLLDLATPGSWQGRDLAAALAGTAAAPSGPVLSHFVPSEGGPGLVALFTGEWKLLAVPDADGGLVPRALFDLRNDPGEQVDLLASPRGAQPAAALLEWGLRRLEEGRERALTAESVPMDETTRRWMVQMGYLGR